MGSPMKECLVHFFKRFPGDDADKLLAEFTRVEPDTVRSWREERQMPGGKMKRQLPRGETELRLRIFLEALGYELEELRDVSRPSLHLARLIGFGAREVPAIQEQLEYAEASGLYRILKGSAPMKTQAYRIQRIEETTQDELHAAQEKWAPALAPYRLSDEFPALQVVESESPPLSSVTPVAPSPAEMPLRRHRDRSQRRDRQAPSRDTRPARTIMHQVLALDEVVENETDRVALARMVKDRVPPKRLLAVRDFLDLALRS